MKISNAFEVDLPPDEAWPVLMDVEGIVSCIPGAELIDVVSETTYKGKVSVKLGPVNLTFAGTVTFEDIDDAQKRATLRAQGMDEKGRGGVIGKVVFHLEPSDRGSRVAIETDLLLSGMVAQYGRAQGVISAVAQEITNQFAACIAKRLEAERAPAKMASGELAPGSAQECKPVEPVRPLVVIWRLFARVLQKILGGAWRRLTGRS